MLSKLPDNRPAIQQVRKYSKPVGLIQLEWARAHIVLLHEAVMSQVGASTLIADFLNDDD